MVWGCLRCFFLFGRGGFNFWSGGWFVVGCFLVLRSSQENPRSQEGRVYAALTECFWGDSEGFRGKPLQAFAWNSLMLRWTKKPSQHRPKTVPKQSQNRPKNRSKTTPKPPQTPSQNWSKTGPKHRACKSCKWTCSSSGLGVTSDIRFCTWSMASRVGTNIYSGRKRRKNMEKPSHCCGFLRF